MSPKQSHWTELIFLVSMVYNTSLIDWKLTEIYIQVNTYDSAGRIWQHRRPPSAHEMRKTAHPSRFGQLYLDFNTYSFDKKHTMIYIILFPQFMATIWDCQKSCDQELLSTIGRKSEASPALVEARLGKLRIFGHLGAYFAFIWHISPVIASITM